MLFWLLLLLTHPAEGHAGKPKAAFVGRIQRCAGQDWICHWELATCLE